MEQTEQVAAATDTGAASAILGGIALHLEGDTLSIGKQDIKLTSIERWLAHTLIEGIASGGPVKRTTLMAVAWPHGAPPSNSIEVIIGRLRAKVRPFGIDLPSHRGVGYSLRAQS